MFEKEAEELFKKKPLGYEMKPELEIYTDGFKDGYNKANEWHYCKDELPPRKNSTSGDSKDVFVATKGYGNYEGHYVFAEETWFNINGEIIPAVYAWIELPVPPKESE